MKKLVFLFMAITFATPALAKVNVHFFSYNGLQYRLLDNEVTVWEGYYYKLKTVTIPETVTYKKKIYKVTSINSAFRNCRNLTSVTIPNSVTFIGYGTFEGCSALTSITIPNSVTRIGDYVFRGCSALTSITIPNSVTHIGERVFEGCSALTSITIPNSVIEIGNDAFYNCSNLKSVTIPHSVTSIGKRAFSGCNSLDWIVIESDADFSSSDMGFIKNGFRYKILNKSEVKLVENFNSGKIIIPEKVTLGNTFSTYCIGNRAFEWCRSLTSVIIPHSVTSIGDNAFCFCKSLSSVYIPNSVTSIGSYAFNYCESLSSVYIPNSVTSIGSYAFNGCSRLTSVYIPNSVTTIGDCAFCRCNSLTSVYIPKSVTNVGHGAFGLDNIKIMCEAQRQPQNWNVKWKNRGDMPSDGRDSYADVSWGQQSPILPPTPPLPPLFSYFAQDMVERNLTEWQKKGEFEKVADWQRRVNNETRNKKIKELTIKAEKEYIEKAADRHTPYVLGTYDTENEVFMVTNAKYGIMLVPVHFNEAKNFKQQWEQITKETTYLIDKDTIDIKDITFTLPNGEQYKYNSKASLNYEVAQVNYNFGPIEIPAGVTENHPKGQQLVTTNMITVGQSDVDVNIPITGQKNENLFAVIIANETYQKEAQVPFALNDGHVFAEYCKKTLGIPEKNLHLVNNATLNNMKYEINWLKQVIEAYGNEASVIFYYAGHGIPDEAQKTAYLLPIDGFGNDVSTGYKLDDLYTSLGNLPSRSVTVFLDACFSGANRDGKMLASARGIAIKAKSSAPQGNMVVFSAAQGDETAYPNNEQQHGMFTYYLLKKIKETSGNVTYKDLGDYVTENVKKQSIVVNGKSQTPIVVPSATVQNEWNTWILNRNF